MKKMMIMSVLALVATAQARADGFVCNAIDQNLTVKVYNHTDAADGTRNAAVMVLSDPSVAEGRKTIARFTDTNELVANAGASYLAQVDLRYADDRRKGEYVGGTRLGYIDTLQLDVAFLYSEPVAAGEILSGALTINKRNGEQLVIDMECERYLKQN